MDKRHARRLATQARKDQVDRDALSRSIMDRVVSSAGYCQANTVMWYVDKATEVQTMERLTIAVQSGKQIVVPYCEGDQLRAFLLVALSELVPGAYGILEPKPEMRNRPERSIRPDALDLILIPGLAFDHLGGRLGYGRGYYDRFLSQTPGSALRYGLAFESQLWREIPMDEHDVRMDYVVTENRMIRCGQGLGLRAEGQG